MKLCLRLAFRQNAVASSPEQNHLLGCHKFSGLPVPTFGRDEVSSCRWHDGKAIEVDAAGYVGVPMDLVVAGFFLFIHKRCDFLTQCVEDPERYVCRCWNCVADDRARIEGVGEVLLKRKASWKISAFVQILLDSGYTAGVRAENNAVVSNDCSCSWTHE